MPKKQQPITIGEIKNKELREIALKRQENAESERNPDVPLNAGPLGGGFWWCKTPEGHAFWYHVCYGKKPAVSPDYSKKKRIKLVDYKTKEK